MENTVNRYLNGVLGKNIAEFREAAHCSSAPQLSDHATISSQGQKDPKSHSPTNIIHVTGIPNKATFGLAGAHLSTCITLEKQECKHKKFFMVPSDLRVLIREKEAVFLQLEN